MPTMRPSQLTALSSAVLRSVAATTTTTITTAPVAAVASSSCLLRTFTTTSTCPKLVQPQSRTASPDHPVNIPSPARPVKMSTTPINSQAVLDLIKARRTYYPLSKDLTISKERIQEIVKDATTHVPSSFNAQSNRVVVLFGEEHERLWDIASEILKAIVPADQWEGTAGKMAMFKAAAGTVSIPPLPPGAKRPTYRPYILPPVPSHWSADPWLTRPRPTGPLL